MNICALYSKLIRKYYLAHIDCLHRIYQQKNLIVDLKSYVGTTVYLRSKLSQMNQQKELAAWIKTRKYLSLMIDFYHPITTNLYYHLEKIQTVIANQYNFKEQINWENNPTNPIQQKGIIQLPYFEFRIHMIIFQSHSAQEPLDIEFFVDLTKIAQKLEKNVIEINYTKDQNKIVIYGDIVGNRSSVESEASTAQSNTNVLPAASANSLYFRIISI